MRRLVRGGADTWFFSDRAPNNDLSYIVVK